MIRFYILCKKCNIKYISLIERRLKHLLHIWLVFKNMSDLNLFLIF